MVIKKSLFLLLVTNLFCVEPHWFANPKPNPNGFYGLGSGESIAIAKRNATADLSSSIHLSIQSTFSSESKRVNQTLSSSATQKINIHTKELTLSNLVVSQAECEEGVCYARVEISRADLLTQLRGKIILALEEFNSLQSPFDYVYKKNVLFPSIMQDYSLFASLGGVGIAIPKSVGDTPVFNLVFRYDGVFSKSFKNILEKTIKDNLVKYSKISTRSDWKIIVKIIKEGKGVAIGVSANHLGEEIYSASVFDVQKPNISNSFFAKRLGIQTYKKINKWGKYKEGFVEF